MSAKSPTRKQWSLWRKVLAGIILFLSVLALALGLGLGLTLGNGDDDNSNTDQPTLTPLPSPNSTLTWTPNINDTWQIILSHPPIVSAAVAPNVNIFDVDLFDTPVSTIEHLHNAGRRVVCYFSAGSYEDWRPDAKNFQDMDLGKTLDGWVGEKWLKLGSANVREIMRKRIEMAKAKKCDGIDPDNVDGYVWHSLLYYMTESNRQ
jgi:endo-alpha-1,4-polygalactosaminidase (GH114 family)